MNEHDKKTALRMIPYGLYVATAGEKNGEMAAATVNWVTQTSFNPPLVAVGIKAETAIHKLIKEKKKFILNMLGKDQKGAAFAFFKPTHFEDGRLNGQDVQWSDDNIPLLKDAPAAVTLDVEEIIPKGDHHLVLGRVSGVHLPKKIEGRPDDAILEMRDLGDNVFYGG